ncbi:MAG: malonyl-[acyl-carrier protein] O-methyltransferase BioC [Spirochaetes bacterium GWC1_27_15]|nr:MAG: malonyl-[acyl-carrier protein] O-methyltransferase BioC [Spirochaetes bacterium GWB1_27_13]OHD22687.1 MAG: malonyl-[acyl-carrier protein] O-methyltransferase BioC [Spirochaetes bacterium GWC1_27_15]
MFKKLEGIFMLTEKIRQNFSKHSTDYDTNAKVQKEMANELIDLIKNQGVFKKIFEIGCGTGFFSKLLLDLAPETIILNDISPKMLELTKNELIDHQNIQFIESNFENYQLKNKFDLITGNATFQWFKNIFPTFTKIFNSLEKSGVLAFSTFIDGTFFELDKAFKQTYLDERLPYKKHTLSFYSEDEIKECLERIGFKIIDSYTKDYVFYFSHPKEFLKSVHQIGAASFSQDTVKYSIMKKMFENYIKIFQNNTNLIPATYKVLFVIGKK